MITRAVESIQVILATHIHLPFVQCKNHSLLISSSWRRFLLDLLLSLYIYEPVFKP